MSVAGGKTRDLPEVLHLSPVDRIADSELHDQAPLAGVLVDHRHCLGRAAAAGRQRRARGRLHREGDPLEHRRLKEEVRHRRVEVVGEDRGDRAGAVGGPPAHKVDPQAVLLVGDHAVLPPVRRRRRLAVGDRLAAAQRQELVQAEEAGDAPPRAAAPVLQVDLARGRAPPAPELAATLRASSRSAAVCCLFAGAAFALASGAGAP
eukprot:CAMPEP_0171205802 /NCGR_PEP_ID=MMETSP0790-20130122/26736_1 /TAXON_ID=2925 /ORGANISM="Alexandrium catenella, Strain OF101" /LENGTH=205 /DNA_ID=CAMNT_0011671329 /DNA_START=38 /DNA_END=652 /DNA_ORIENTATION=-